MSHTNDPTLSLSTEATELIEQSHAAAAAQMPQIVATFYELLFERHPTVRAMFPKDMNRQREHLTVAIAMVARNASRLDLLSEPLKQLGARHVAYGTRAEHYPIVRDLLIESLAGAMGSAWTSAHQRAWYAALTNVAGVMLSGAAEYERTTPLASPSPAPTTPERSSPSGNPHRPTHV